MRSQRICRAITIRPARASEGLPISGRWHGQYVAIVTGGEFEKLSRPSMTPEGAPPDSATTLWVFALPQR